MRLLGCHDHHHYPHAPPQHASMCHWLQILQTNVHIFDPQALLLLPPLPPSPLPTVLDFQSAAEAMLDKLWASTGQATVPVAKKRAP
jgi:hypothetical protein